MVPRRATIVVCALALALAGCGSDEEPGVDEPAREGLSLKLDGVNYNVFITRQLNPKIPADDAYVTEEAPPGEALWGVFLQACNTSDSPQEPVSEFIVKDNQENTFEPEPLPGDNQFVYTPRRLLPKECIPEAGSVAQLGPSGGAMLLFQLPLDVTENRPLELEIEADNGEKLTYELDI
jgi:hypothetical protein